MRFLVFVLAAIGALLIQAGDTAAGTILLVPLGVVAGMLVLGVALIVLAVIIDAVDVHRRRRRRRRLRAEYKRQLAARRARR